MVDVSHALQGPAVFPAAAAHEQTFSSMRAPVEPQLSPTSEPVSTLTAAEGIFLVSAQEEGLGAEPAVLGSLTGVQASVSPQRSLVDEEFVTNTADVESLGLNPGPLQYLGPLESYRAGS